MLSATSATCFKNGEISAHRNRATPYAVVKAEPNASMDVDASGDLDVNLQYIYLLSSQELDLIRANVLAPGFNAKAIPAMSFPATADQTLRFWKARWCMHNVGRLLNRCPYDQNTRLPFAKRRER